MRRGGGVRGGAFSIEDPLSFLIWQLKEVKAPAKLPGVKANTICQCMLGSLHIKPTLFLNNLEGFEDAGCSQAIRHVHVPWVGKVFSYSQDGQSYAFYTELAAEYPRHFAFRLRGL